MLDRNGNWTSETDEAVFFLFFLFVIKQEGTFNSVQFIQII